MGDSAADVEGHQASGALQTAKDLFAGAAGGVAQVLLGKELPYYSSQSIILDMPLSTARWRRSTSFGDER